MKNVYRLILEPEAGCLIDNAAQAAYDLSQELGIRVDFEHNDQVYRVQLRMIPIEPIRKDLCQICQGAGYSPCIHCEATGRKDKGGR